MADSTFEKKILSINSKLTTLTDDSKIYSFSPILHRAVDYHTGVKMYGKFYTNDASDQGKISYATFWRNKNFAVPHDGVGLGWRKGDGSAYNVYVVDNNPLNQDVFLTNSILREDVGINNFIASAKMEILKETWYWFSIKLLDDNSIVVKIWTGVIGDEPLDSAAPGVDYVVILVGARAYPYRDGDQTDYEIGFGVENTEGYIWRYDDIEVQSINTGYPYSYFKWKTDLTDFTGPFTTKYYGYGVDEDSNYGVDFYLLDSSQSWELVGSNTSTSGDDVDLTKIEFSHENISEYRQPDGYVYSAARPSGIVGEKNLYSYYSSFENIIPSGIHVGNHIDIWVNSPSKIVEEEIQVDSINGEISVSTVNFSTPIQEIITLVDSGETELAESDWSLSTDPGTAFSINPSQKIVLSGYYSGVNETFSITYRYFSDGAAMQTFVDSEEFRNPSSSNLIKIKPPHVLEFNNLNYRGSITEEEIISVIKNYVYGLDTIFEISDFLNHLYLSGVTYVDISSLNITVRSYNYKNLKTSGTQTLISSFYEISELGSFYTYDTDIGVTKLV
jgi:hypothetical protein